MSRTRVRYGAEYRYGRRLSWRERFWLWARGFFSYVDD